MRIGRYFLLFYLSLLGVRIGQTQSLKSEVENKTEGSCSQILLDNHGTLNITCTGFSENQSKEIEKLLRGLSKSETKDRDLILQKLDEVLDEVRKSQEQSKQRTITDEQAQKMKYQMSYRPWENVIVSAPSGDPEAINLAVRIRGILSSYGFAVAPVDYDSKVPDIRDADVVLLNNSATFGGATDIWDAIHFCTSLRIKKIPWGGSPPKTGVAASAPSSWDKKAPIHVYILPKKG